MSDKDVKKEFKKKAQANPDNYYPVKTLKELGFKRNKCECGQYYWSTTGVEHCGEPVCSGGLTFINDTPAKNKLSYVEVWKEFSSIHKKLGYAPIKRYPVVARWNPTMDFTIASIAAFQPFVVSGEVKPPANPLVIPQFCLRFGDIDNVGVTGHFCGFVMMGEHAFVAPKEYDINKYLKDHLIWLNQGMGLSNDDIIIHEDAWAGGGNFGPCVEFFSRGLEVSNQVYMQYEVPNKELNIKVLDMGQGHERAAWFTQGKPSIYECVFPKVIEKLRKITGVKYDEEFMTKFVPLSSYLKIDEAPDLDKAYKNVAKKLNMPFETFKSKVQEIAALYSVAEHARVLLFALRDGALPSNVGGMYNLRILLRRALRFIDRYNWKIDLCDVLEWHAEDLKPLFPELSDNLSTTRKILEVEKIKYEQTKEKVSKLVQKYQGKKLTNDQLIELYDSQGVDPRDLNVDVPEKFYSLVTEKHEEEKQKQTTQTHREEKIDLPELPETKALYFDDWKKIKCTSKVLAVKDDYVVLDQTVFYPVSGGQMQDSGLIDCFPVIDVFKQGSLIVHKIEGKVQKGDEVNCEVNLVRRKQLTQHHTATHLVNAATRIVLGQHINQASAKKDVDHAYLDVTHYQSINDQELQLIEDEANKLVKNKIEIIKKFMPRGDAEKIYGTRIYQGGVAPGKNLRIVDIKKVEVEACGGTHLNNTGEAELIKLVKTSKVKDGVVRIFFLAGNAAKKFVQEKESLEQELAKALSVEVQEVPSRLEELFELWKTARKAHKKGKKLDNYDLTKKEVYSSDVISKCSEMLKTQPEHLIKTVQKFKKELEEFKK